MIKNVIVTFEFDTENDSVTNVHCEVDGVEKKKRTTRKKSDVVEEMASEPLITLEATKLIFNNKAVADMGIEYEDRIVIKWEQLNKTLIPIIGKDISFDEEGSGNKVTKANSIGYKGKQNAVLAEIGEQFTIVPFTNKKYPEGIWRLVSTVNPDASKPFEEAAPKVVRKIEPILIVDDTEETPIDTLKFTLN